MDLLSLIKLIGDENTLDPAQLLFSLFSRKLQERTFYIRIQTQNNKENGEVSMKFQHDKPIKMLDVIFILKPNLLKLYLGILILFRRESTVLNSNVSNRMQQPPLLNPSPINLKCSLSS